MKKLLLTLGVFAVASLAVNAQKAELRADVTASMTPNPALKLERQVKKVNHATAVLKPNAKSGISTRAYTAPTGAQYYPERALYEGANAEGDGWVLPIILVPRMSVKYVNESPSTFKSFSWTYGVNDGLSTEDGGDPTEYTSTDKDLTVDYSKALYSSAPTLTAKGSSESTYTPKKTTSEGDAVGLVVSSAYPVDLTTGKEAGSFTVQPFMGNLTATGDAAGNSFFGKNSLTTQNGFVGYGVRMDRPLLPLSLVGFYMYGGKADLASDAQLVVNVYPVNENNQLTSETPLATAKCNASDIQNLGTTDDPFYQFPFMFYIVDEDGFETPLSRFAIDQDVMFVLEGYTDDSAVKSFDLCVNATLSVDRTKVVNVDYKKDYSFIYYKNSAGQVDVKPTSDILSYENGANPLYGTLSTHFVGEYVLLDLDAHTLADAAGTGVEKTFNIESYYLVNSLLSGGEDYASLTGEGLDDWFTATVTDAADRSGSTLTVKVDALPDGVKGRTGVLTLTTFGVSTQLTIVQGEGGVSVVEGTGNKVAVVDGNFEVTAAKAGVVEVYNIAGQKVASAQVDGSAVVPAQNLAKGLYVVKFADNTVVKVMK